MNFELHMSPTAWQSLALGLLALLLLLAGMVDARERRVPNTLVLVALMAGVLLHAIGPQTAGSNGGLFSVSPGALGAGRSLLGALVALLVFLPFYALRVLGAGDVKLLVSVGAFAGTAAFVNIALWVLLAGGLLALARMALARNARLLVRNTLATLGQMLPGSAGTFDARSQTAWRMPYAVAIATGVMGYGMWTLTGHPPFLNF